MAGLLDQYGGMRLSDLPMNRQPKTRGLLNMLVDNPETLAGLIADFTPVVGDVKSAYDGVQSAREGDWLGAGLGAMGALPMVPNMAGMVRTPLGRIAENSADSNTLAEMLTRAGKSKGYDVSMDASGISPSRYITFRNPSDETGELTRQVRISNHADKHPSLAEGARTSSDPDTGVTFEQAVNWLAREGYPTTLSTRFKSTPTWEEHYAQQAALRSAPSARLEQLQSAWRNKPKATRGPMPTLDSLMK